MGCCAGKGRKLSLSRPLPWIQTGSGLEEQARLNYGREGIFSGWPSVSSRGRRAGEGRSHARRGGNGCRRKYSPTSDVSLQRPGLLGYNNDSIQPRGKWLFHHERPRGKAGVSASLTFGDLVVLAVQESGNVALAARVVSVLINSGAICLRRRVIRCK